MDAASDASYLRVPLVEPLDQPANSGLVISIATPPRLSGDSLEPFLDEGGDAAQWDSARDDEALACRSTSKGEGRGDTAQAKVGAALDDRKSDGDHGDASAAPEDAGDGLHRLKPPPLTLEAPPDPVLASPREARELGERVLVGAAADSCLQAARDCRQLMWGRFGERIGSEPGVGSVEGLRGAPEQELRAVLHDFLDSEAAVAQAPKDPDAPEDGPEAPRPPFKDTAALRCVLLTELLHWAHGAEPWPPQGPPGKAGERLMGRPRPRSRDTVLEQLSQPEFWRGAVCSSVSRNSRKMLTRSTTAEWMAHITEELPEHFELQYDLTPKRVRSEFNKLLLKQQQQQKRLPLKRALEGQRQLSVAHLEESFMQLEERRRMPRTATRSLIQRLREVLADGEEQDEECSVSVGDFHLCLRQLTLAWHLRDEFISPGSKNHSLWVADYNHEACRQQQELSNDDMFRFFFSTTDGPDPSMEPAVRWVHVSAVKMDLKDTAPFSRTVFCLATKYGLHPVAVEDVLDKEDDMETPTKMDAYMGCEGSKGHYFFSLEALFLDKTATQADPITSEASRASQASVPPRVRVHRGHVCIFIGGVPDYDTVITTHRRRSARKGRLARHWGNDSNDDGAEEVTSELFRELWQQVSEEPPRRLREHRADFLLYEILDKVVRRLQPIASAYNARLGYFYQQMRDLKSQFPRKWLDELSDVKLELEDISRSLRPLRTVVHSVIKDSAISTEATTFLEDVVDHLDQVTLDLDGLASMCTDLPVTYDTHTNRRINDVLLTLTILTALVMPVQVFAGVYGMNFVSASGDPAIPELTWTYGYFWFWLFTMSGTILMAFMISFTFFRRQTKALALEVWSWRHQLMSGELRDRLLSGQRPLILSHATSFGS